MSASPKPCSSCGQPLAPGRKLPLCPACLTKGWQRSKSGIPSPATSGVFEIPGYEITGELARGGMGVVYRARQKHPQREVAVKMLMPQMAQDDLRERFRIEARVMAGLVHPGIMPIYQYGEHTGVPWISMVLCGKGSLAARRGEYAGQWRRIAELMLSLSEAVAFAHARGVLHRDLKPGNVLFDDDDRAFLSDFGLAKIVSEHSDLTRTVSLVGTPHYLAPELINNAAQATTASDIYALGAILYELLAGRPPFDGQNVAAILKQISEKEVEPLAHEVPHDLATLALKCLSKPPDRRYATAQALADDLSRWLAGEPITARRMSAGEKLVFWCKRKPALAAMSFLLIAAIAGAGALAWRSNRELRIRLRDSLIAEVRTTRLTARVQGRHDALEAVKRAAALGSTPELEEEAASLLALPSMRFVRSVPAGTSDHWKFIPDEDLVHVADFTEPGFVRVAELDTGRELARFAASDSAWGGQHAFSADGRLIVYEQGPDLQTTVRDWRTGKVMLGPLSPRRISPRFSRDSRSVAMGLDDGRVEIYDLTRPGSAPQYWPALHSGGAEPLAYSPDDRWLAVKTLHSHQITLRSTSDGQAAMTVGRAEDGQTLCTDWFSDSQGVMLGSRLGAVRSWAFGSQSSRVLPAHSAQVYGVAVHPLGQLALSSGYDSRTWILDWNSGRALGMEPVNSFMTRFSRDGTRAMLHDFGLSSLRFYEVEVPTVCRQFTLNTALGGQRPSKGSWCAEVSPNGRLLASAGIGEAALYDVSTSRHLGVLKGGGGNTLAWTPDGRQLWLPEGPVIVRYHIEPQASGIVIARLGTPIRLPTKYAMRLTFAAQSDRWALTVQDGFCHGTTASDQFTHVPAPKEMPASEQHNPVALSPDGRWAAVSAEFAGKVGIYDLQAARWVKFFAVTENTAYNFFTADGERLWTCSWRDRRIFKTGTWEPMETMTDRRQPGLGGTIQGSRDGRLITTQEGMNIALRDGTTGRPFLHLQHPSPVPPAWLALTANGRWLTFSGMGHIQQVWDLARLEAEMKKLGLPWRGAHLEQEPAPPPFTTLVVE